MNTTDDEPKPSNDAIINSCEKEYLLNTSVLKVFRLDKRCYIYFNGEIKEINGGYFVSLCEQVKDMNVTETMDYINEQLFLDKMKFAK